MMQKFESLKEVRELIDKLDLKCRWCKEPLTGADLKYYPHIGGWEVEQLGMKVWLYVECKCRHGWSLHKLIHQAKIKMGQKWQK